jgi:hypothetical protein
VAWPKNRRAIGLPSHPAGPAICPCRWSFPSRMQRFEREMVTTLSFELRSFYLDLLALRTP